MATPHHRHIILEIIIVRTTHIRLHMTCQGIHRHKSRPKEEFIIFQRIHRSHNGILLSLVRKYRHFVFSIKRFLYFRFRASGFFHNTITISLFHSPGHDGIHLLLCQLISKRSCFLFPFFLEETRLQVLRHMFINSLFRIFLHTWINSGIDLKTVCINIVVGTVFLLVFSTPAEKRIRFPCQWIFIIFLHLPSAIITFLRLLGCHYSTQIFTEVSCQTFFMIHTTIF